MTNYEWLKRLWYRLVLSMGFFNNIPLTEEAEVILTQAVEDYGRRVIEKAHKIATEEGHPENITEANVIQASVEVL